MEICTDLSIQPKLDGSDRILPQNSAKWPVHANAVLASDIEPSFARHVGSTGGLRATHLTHVLCKPTETHVLRENGPNLVGEHLAPCTLASTTCQSQLKVEQMLKNARTAAKGKDAKAWALHLKTFVKRHALVVNDMVSKLNGLVV